MFHLTLVTLGKFVGIPVVGSSGSGAVWNIYPFASSVRERQSIYGAIDFSSLPPRT
jgi:hypothetical protein